MPPADPVRRLCRIGFVALFVLRALVPTEGTAEGSTILLAQGGLLLGLLWSWSFLRDESHRVRVLPIDWALLALVVWQAVSAAHVVIGEGHRRAAVNGAWEWVSVFVVYFVGQQVFTTRDDARRLVCLLAGTTVALGGLGVWQSAVEIPRLREIYLEESGEFDRLLAIPLERRSVEQQQRLVEVSTNFAAQGVPIDGPGRMAFEQRLLHSSEPLGRFALANTFAGWLIPGILVIGGLLVAGFRRGPDWSRLVPLAAALAVALVCLVLTKSRTAYVGLAAGVVIAVVAWLRESQANADEAVDRAGRARTWWLAAGVAGVALLVGLPVLFGGLDAAVVSQAPRSLAFRLQYWGATSEMIRDAPLFGTGPGNFRQHYQRVKWPEASEEIADPHNLVLDVWATAGTPALLALVAVVVLGARGFGRASRMERLGPFVPRTGPLELDDDIRTGTVLGFGGLAGWLAFLGDSEWTELGLLLAVCLLVDWLCEWVSNAGRVPVVVLGAGVAGVLVHLLGAGGIAMPAVQSVLLMSLVIVSWQRSESVELKAPRSLALGVCAGGLFVAGLLTATVPVLGCGLEFMTSRVAQLDGRPDLAAEALGRASERDPLSPDGPDARAALEFGMWRAARRPSPSRLRSIVAIQEETIRRDPFAAKRYETLATMLAEGFRSTGEVAFGERADEVYQQATKLYPTRSGTHAEHAVLLAELGRRDAAATAARRALELDAINRREGHTDRLLPEADVERLRELAESGPAGTE